MIDALSMLQVILRDAGFTTTSITVEGRAGVCFEDDSVVGFACVFTDAAELLSNWNSVELSFLTRHSQSLRGAGDKAWNVYLVFLASQSSDSATARQVRWIEEDLNQTRKIAACGLNAREDLINALLPLLPIQSQPALETEDVTARLKRRIGFIAPRAATLALDDSIQALEVVRVLGEQA
jgi:hypothetical protein